MLKYSLIFLFLLGTFVPASVAQDTPTWYFAYNKENGSLVAYTLTGETNTLIEQGVTGLNVIGTRINQQEALLLLRVDEVFGLYHATPNQITQLVGEDGILQVPLATTTGAAVMVKDYTREPVYAAVFKDGALTRLPNAVIAIPSYARFSQDGRFFRYLGLNDQDHIVLWNYEVSTGENIAIFEFGADLPVLRADTYGEYWLHRAILPSGEASYQRIGLNGIENLGQFDESHSAGSVHILGNELVIYAPFCETDCPFEVRNGAAIQTFQGDGNTFHSLPIARLTDDTLLMLSRADQFYLVSTDAPPQLIGAFTRDQSHIFSSSFLAISPDQQWLMMVDSVEAPTEHYLYNLLTGETAATYAYADIPYLRRVQYGEGVIVLTLNDNSYAFLVYQPDGTYQMTSLPNNQAIRVYFEMLPEQTALYRTVTGNTYTGIYLHDFKQGTETPILEGAWEFITLMELR